MDNTPSIAADDEQFWQMADGFIELANQYCENIDPAEVNAALVYAATRFSAFIAATSSVDKAAFVEDMDSNMELLSRQFRSMLGQNLRDYKDNFKVYTRIEE